jgi:hypothetical protein
MSVKVRVRGATRIFRNAGTDGTRWHGAGSSQTLSWREVDSNHQFRHARDRNVREGSADLIETAFGRAGHLCVISVITLV